MRREAAIVTNGTERPDLVVLTGKAQAVDLDTDPHTLLDDAYRKHVDRIYRYCLFRTNSFSDAEDIVSETFIRFLRSAVSEQKITSRDLRTLREVGNTGPVRN